MTATSPLPPEGTPPPSGDEPSFTVGFDLDMTLIDSRPGIREVFLRLSAETGVPIDVDLVVSRLGPPLEREIENWFPADRVAAMSDRYRTLYPDHAIALTQALPGAREAVAAVRAHGGRAIVVTAKHEPSARAHLRHLGVEPDAVVGSLWAEAKAEALRLHGASVYVGDHVGDVRGALTAGALSVAVPTGPCGPEVLREAGAHVVLDDLTGFPAWLAGHRACAAQAPPAG